MPFLNVKRTVVPTDLTLPVTAQTTGNKAAGFFTGWDSGTTNVFNSGGMGGAKALQEINGDGRIAVTSISSWRDCEVTTYGVVLSALLRLTAAGRAIVVNYSINNAGGLLAVYEMTGINPALPISFNSSNGTVVREIISEAGTLVSKFGPSGSVVNAGYTTSYAPGQTLTVGIVGTRIYVKWGGTLIIDLPYDAWTWMAHGKVALAPSALYGLDNSSVDFLPLASTTSDYSNPAAPILRMEDFGLKSIRQNGCSISAGSTTLTVPSTTPWRVGDKGIVETGQVVCTVTPGGGNVGNGTFVTGTPFLSTDDDLGLLASWATGNWLVTFTSATAYTVTRPGGAAGGTGTIDRRYNNGITFQIMDGGTWSLDAQDHLVRTGRVQFVAGDTFTIACAASGETAAAAFDGKVSAGRRRTVGVGGVKPSLSVTQAQVNANTMIHPQGTIAYISDNPSGNINRVVFNGATSYGVLAGIPDYYKRETRPQALQFTVVAILSPTTLQISTPAVAATANATVWIDSWLAFDRVLGNRFSYCNNVKVRIPAGDYVLGQLGNYIGRTGWQIKGAGMDVTNFYKPRGHDDGVMNIADWVDGGTEAVCDFTIVGSDHPNGGWSMDPTTYPGEHVNLGVLLALNTSFNTSISRVKIINSRGNALNIGTCQDCYNIDCVGIKTVPSINYSGWYFANSNCEVVGHPCGTINATMIFAWLQGGLETFQSVGAPITGFHGTNCVLSTNSSSDYNIASGVFRFTRNSQFGPGFDVGGTQALSVSSNQDHSATFGGVITNCDFLYEGFLNEANDMHSSLSVNLSPPPGVIVDGTYNPLVANDGARKGLISRADFIGSDTSHSPAIVVAESELTLTNYRILGAASGGFAQIYNQAGIITANNNIRDTGPVGIGTNNQTGNVTNAAYNALLRHDPP